MAPILSVILMIGAHLTNWWNSLTAKTKDVSLILMSGTVDSHSDKERAEDVVSSVSGVVSAVNDLKVE